MKSFLFLLITSVLVLYLLQPYWEVQLPKETALVIPKEKKKENFYAIAKELGVDKIYKAGEEIKEVNKVILYGQEFSEDYLLSIPLIDLEWMPQPISEGNFEDINWKGVLQYGQLQQLKGKVSGAAGSRLEIRFSEQVLATQEIGEDGKVEAFFPALVLGRNEMEIFIGDEKVGNMRFYVQEAEVLDVEVKVGFPNPEARIITDYLRKRGERAKLNVQVSKDARIISEMENKGKSIIFIDPTQLSNINVDDLGTTYSGLFLFNLSNPEQDVFNLNRKLNTAFELNKIGAVSLENDKGISIFPHEFMLKGNQDSLFSSAFETKGDYIVGVSLLESSFELQFSGDSTAYAKIWEPILEQLSPRAKKFYSLSKPVFEGQMTMLYQLDESLEDNEIEPAWKKDPAHEDLFTYQFTPRTGGWQELFDDFPVYVERDGDFDAVRQHQLILEFLNHRRDVAEEITDQTNTKRNIPDWVWFLVILASATFVWMEPRFRN